MNNLKAFKTYFVKRCKIQFTFMNDLLLIGYVKWIIKSEQVADDMSELIYKIDKKMKD